MMDNIIIALFLGFVVLLIVLDIAMVVSLVKSGDERRQLMVWKASTFTLIGTVGVMILNVVKMFVAPEEISAPFSQLGASRARRSTPSKITNTTRRWRSPSPLRASWKQPSTFFSHHNDEQSRKNRGCFLFMPHRDQDLGDAVCHGFRDSIIEPCFVSVAV